MKIFFKKIFTFGFVLLIAYPSLVLLWGLFVPDLYKPNLIFVPELGMLEKRMEDLDTTTTGVDILFLGSSHSYRSFDPRIFAEAGYSVFNLGSSAQTHIQTNYFLEEYLEQLDPGLVVYEVYPNMFEIDGVESGVNLISVESPFDRDILEQVLILNHIKLYNTYLFVFLKELLNLDFSQDLSPPEGKYIEGGYVQSFKEFDGDEEISSSTWTPGKAQKIKFEQNLEILQEKKIPYVFVIAPFLYSYSNDKEISEYLNSKGKLYDYNKIMEFSRKHFYDPIHVNQSGVNKMNRHFIDIIKNDFSWL